MDLNKLWQICDTNSIPRMGNHEGIPPRNGNTYGLISTLRAGYSVIGKFQDDRRLSGDYSGLIASLSPGVRKPRSTSAQKIS